MSRANFTVSERSDLRSY